MKKLLVFGLLATFIILAVPSEAWAHPGNTDSNGGHTCRTNCPKWGLSYGEYHYHNPKPKPAPTPVVKPKPKPKPAPVYTPPVYVPTYISPKVVTPPNYVGPAHPTTSQLTAEQLNTKTYINTKTKEEWLTSILGFYNDKYITWDQAVEMYALVIKYHD